MVKGVDGGKQGSCTGQRVQQGDPTVDEPRGTVLFVSTHKVEEAEGVEGCSDQEVDREKCLMSEPVHVNPPRGVVIVGDWCCIIHCERVLG